MLLEIEVDGANNGNLFFAPLARTIRGRFDFRRVAEPLAAMKLAEFPDGVPGQRIALDVGAGEAAVVEPLREPKYAELKAKLEKRGYGVAPEREPVEAPDFPTLLYWLKRAVEAGAARVVAGKLPDKIDGKVRKRFFSVEPADPRDKTQRAFLAFMMAKMSPEERKSFNAFMGDGAD